MKLPTAYRPTPETTCNKVYLKKRCAKSYSCNESVSQNQNTELAQICGASTVSPKVRRTTTVIILHIRLQYSRVDWTDYEVTSGAGLQTNKQNTLSKVTKQHCQSTRLPPEDRKNIHVFLISLQEVIQK